MRASSLAAGATASSRSMQIESAGIVRACQISWDLLVLRIERWDSFAQRGELQNRPGTVRNRLWPQTVPVPWPSHGRRRVGCDEEGWAIGVSRRAAWFRAVYLGDRLGVGPGHVQHLRPGQHYRHPRASPSAHLLDASPTTSDPELHPDPGLAAQALHPAPVDCRVGQQQRPDTRRSIMYNLSEDAPETLNILVDIEKAVRLKFRGRRHTERRGRP